MEASLLIASLAFSLAAPPAGEESRPSTPPQTRVASRDGSGTWSAEGSELCRRYRDATVEASIARLERIRAEPTRPSSAADRTRERRALELEREIRKACLRTLVVRGLSLPRGGDATPERAEAIAAIRGISHPLELEDAVEVLRGEGSGGDLVMTEPDVRDALLKALASDPRFGHAKLVDFGVTGCHDLSSAARDALPRELSPSAVDALRTALASSRERDVNRAAMIAGAHPAGSLIPALIQAQFEERTTEPQGDEAWIAIGKSTAYVAGLVPVVGNASGAFQPIPGVVYEGSVLRIMESAVTIYRTEVHGALLATIEGTTGEPAPAFGFDRDRWLAWYRNDYPRLAQAFQRERLENEAAAAVRTSAPRTDT